LAASPDPGGAGNALAAIIQRHGPVSFEQVVELALYHPEYGFFSRGGAAGRRHGDFITSPEVGPLFGQIVARAVDECWRDLGEPDPFVVVECGAGTGTLARALLAASPACAAALTYVLVERAAALRAHHHEHLPLSPSHIVGAGGSGPRVVSRAEPPAVVTTGVTIANELLDNLPFRLAQRDGAIWHEVRVGYEATTSRFIELSLPAPDALADHASRLVPDAPDGARIPVQSRAAGWLRDALARVDLGRVIVIDYASTTPLLAHRPMREWIRTYRGHEAGVGPLEALGRQDITVEVCIDQLSRVRRPDRDRAQTEFLRDHGLAELVSEGRRIWHERAYIGDLEAVRGRSRVTEAEALTDPVGLGSFRVLEWDVAGL